MTTTMLMETSVGSLCCCSQPLPCSINLLDDYSFIRWQTYMVYSLRENLTRSESCTLQRCVDSLLFMPNPGSPWTRLSLTSRTVVQYGGRFSLYAGASKVVQLTCRLWWLRDTNDSTNTVSWIDLLSEFPPALLWDLHQNISWTSQDRRPSFDTRQKYSVLVSSFWANHFGDQESSSHHDVDDARRSKSPVL